MKPHENDTLAALAAAKIVIFAVIGAADEVDTKFLVTA